MHPLAPAAFAQLKLNDAPELADRSAVRKMFPAAVIRSPDQVILDLGANLKGSPAMQTRIAKTNQKSKPESSSSGRPKPPFPARKLKKPGLEKDLTPKPQYLGSNYKAANKLAGKKAL